MLNWLVSPNTYEQECGPVFELADIPAYTYELFFEKPLTFSFYNTY